MTKAWHLVFVLFHRICATYAVFSAQSSAIFGVKLELMMKNFPAPALWTSAGDVVCCSSCNTGTQQKNCNEKDKIVRLPQFNRLFRSKINSASYLKRVLMKSLHMDVSLHMTDSRKKECAPCPLPLGSKQFRNGISTRSVLLIVFYQEPSCFYESQNYTYVLVLCLSH